MSRLFANNVSLDLPPVLLTSSVIVSDHSVSLKDENARVGLTIQSIEKWLAIAPELRLIICDGSNYDFSGIVQKKFPQANIECIFFQNNMQLVGLRGKGFGEGEIVNYAIANSTYLRESEYFAKCTSKLWVENFLDCVSRWNGVCLCKGYFADVFSFKRTRFDYIDTRFYLVSKSFYSKYLASTYMNVGDERGLSLEHCFRDAILENEIREVLFSLPPVICGVGGGTGTYYKNNLKRRIKELIRLRIVMSNRSFTYLFA